MLHHTIVLRENQRFRAKNIEWEIKNETRRDSEVHSGNAGEGGYEGAADYIQGADRNEIKNRLWWRENKKALRVQGLLFLICVGEGFDQIGGVVTLLGGEPRKCSGEIT